MSSACGILQSQEGGKATRRAAFPAGFIRRGRGGGRKGCLFVLSLRPMGLRAQTEYLRGKDLYAMKIYFNLKDPNAEVSAVRLIHTLLLFRRVFH